MAGQFLKQMLSSAPTRITQKTKLSALEMLPEVVRLRLQRQKPSVLLPSYSREASLLLSSFPSSLPLPYPLIPGSVLPP